MLPTEELETLFNKFSSVTDPMVDGDRARQETSSNPTWTLEAFTVFLMSPDNSAFSEHNSGVWQDMSHPLYDYYISSSHNTYLVGHQLVGDSTIEGYIRALLHGCRSVEVDIYDGEVEPMIFHGKTLTSKVSLRNVCNAILKYGFVTTDYPIIISAEIHCGVAQQDMIVKIMSEVFGDALIRAPIHGRPKIEALPSPEELKKCILLKAKNLFIRPDRDNSAVALDAMSTDLSSTSESEQGSSALECDADGVAKYRPDASPPVGVPSSSSRQGHRRASSTSVIMSSPSSFLVPSSPKAVGLVRRLSSRRKSQSNAEVPKVKMSFALVALLVYTVGVKFRGINKKEEYAPEHMFSLSENTCHRMMRQGMLDLIKHNRSHLIRIYPRGTRLKSTNFEPHRFWSTGAQLVAINWQTFDLGYMLNHAMFQRNGRSGYVLKPLALRASGKHLLSKLAKHRLEITVISAQQLPRPKDAMGREKMDKSMVDPFVEVSIHVPDWTQPLPQDSHTVGASPDQQAVPGPIAARTISYRTGTVKNNGFNPIWQDKIPLTFECLGDMKDLIFVRFAVKQEDKEDEEPLALYCVSLGSLQHGYRHLPLHDSQLSQYLFSTLFVHIALQDIP
jgi:phosphatidylinositol phospholipase C delta